MLKRFKNDVIKYCPYSIKAGKSILKSDVSTSRLGWLWWILDPLLFMCVYTFVSVIVFGKTEQYFSAFIFIGYNSFKFFEKTLKSSVRILASNKSIIKNIYMPKIVLMMSRLYVNLFEFFISFALVFVAILYYRVPITWKWLYMIPLILLLVIISEAVGTWLMHLGVFIDDLANIINILLRLLFYMSGVFYSIEKRIKDKALRRLLIRINPIAYIISQMREVVLYNGVFDWKFYIILLVIFVLILTLAICTIYKNDNSYAKMI